ncbi:hypothetical protein niasHT_032221 [Heterodera trifolii]|uniref:Effector protein n=1 Tax=Heterodera trifolii TaxID=157864 RepID=A0ABD2HU90_9BILA
MKLFILLLFINVLQFGVGTDNQKGPRIIYLQEPTVHQISPRQFRNFVIENTTDPEWKATKNANEASSSSINIPINIDSDSDDDDYDDFDRKDSLGTGGPLLLDFFTGKAYQQNLSRQNLGESSSSNLLDMSNQPNNLNQMILPAIRNQPSNFDQTKQRSVNDDSNANDLPEVIASLTNSQQLTNQNNLSLTENATDQSVRSNQNDQHEIQEIFHLPMKNQQNNKRAAAPNSQQEFGFDLEKVPKAKKGKGLAEWLGHSIDQKQKIAPENTPTEQPTPDHINLSSQTNQLNNSNNPTNNKNVIDLSEKTISMKQTNEVGPLNSVDNSDQQMMGNAFVQQTASDRSCHSTQSNQITFTNQLDPNNLENAFNPSNFINFQLPGQPQTNNYNHSEQSQPVTQQIKDAQTQIVPKPDGLLGWLYRNMDNSENHDNSFDQSNCLSQKNQTNYSADTSTDLLVLPNTVNHYNHSTPMMTLKQQNYYNQENPTTSTNQSTYPDQANAMALDNQPIYADQANTFALNNPSTFSDQTNSLALNNQSNYPDQANTLTLNNHSTFSDQTNSLALNNHSTFSDQTNSLALNNYSYPDQANTFALNNHSTFSDQTNSLALNNHSTFSDQTNSLALNNYSIYPDQANTFALNNHSTFSDQTNSLALNNQSNYPDQANTLALNYSDQANTLALGIQSTYPDHSLFMANQNNEVNGLIPTIDSDQADQTILQSNEGSMGQQLQQNVQVQHGNVPTMLSIRTPVPEQPFDGTHSMNLNIKSNNPGQKRPFEEPSTSSSVDNLNGSGNELALGILPVYIEKPLALVIEGAPMDSPDVQWQFELLTKILRQMDAKMVEERIKEQMFKDEKVKNDNLLRHIFKKIQKQAKDMFGHPLFENQSNETENEKKNNAHAEILFFFMHLYNKMVKLLKGEHYGNNKNAEDLRVALHKWIKAAKERVGIEFQQFFKKNVTI